MIFQTDKGAKADSGFGIRDSKHDAAKHSLIAEDLKITGNLESTGDITVEGFIDGHIKCRTLEIGQVPNLTCTVEAETVSISGAFSGDVRATKVILTKTARVTGDIFHDCLEVEEGAKLEGRLARLSNAGSKSANAGNDDEVARFKPVEAPTDTVGDAKSAKGKIAEVKLVAEVEPKSDPIKADGDKSTGDKSTGAKTTGSGSD